jgi:beta-lactam-binding protein with PASTA domain
MPDLVGEPVVSAQAELEKVGIKSATPTFLSAPAGQVALGSVIATQPPAGSRVDQTTTVQLTVAK